MISIFFFYRARPKVRPDWTSLLKEVEGGRKLKHVECNDRSKPLLPKVKVKETDKEQFIYESEKSEKETSHNQLLKEVSIIYIYSAIDTYIKN